MHNIDVHAGSFDPAIPGAEWMSESGFDDKIRKIYNIVSHKKCLLDIRIGE